MYLAIISISNCEILLIKLTFKTVRILEIVRSWVPLKPAILTATDRFPVRLDIIENRRCTRLWSYLQSVLDQNLPAPGHRPAPGHWTFSAGLGGNDIVKRKKLNNYYIALWNNKANFHRNYLELSTVCAAVFPITACHQKWDVIFDWSRSSAAS